MSLMSIVMMVLTYVLIGFGFAGGFALFRWSAKKWRQRGRRIKEGRNDGDDNRLSRTDRIMRRL